MGGLKRCLEHWGVGESLSRQSTGTQDHPRVSRGSDPGLSLLAVTAVWKYWIPSEKLI